MDVPMYSSDLEDDEMDRASRKVVGWHMIKLEKQVQRLALDFIHVISIPPSVVDVLLLERSIHNI
jgi:hypothetical protein